MKNKVLASLAISLALLSLVFCDSGDESSSGSPAPAGEGPPFERILPEFSRPSHLLATRT